MIEKQEVKQITWCDSKSQLTDCRTKVGKSCHKLSMLFKNMESYYSESFIQQENYSCIWFKRILNFYGKKSKTNSLIDRNIITLSYFTLL